MTKTVYLIGALANRKIIDLGNRLRSLGFDVFDEWLGPGETADIKFNEYRQRRGMTYIEALKSYLARHIFEFDKHHLDRADAVVLCMPCGKSAHLELGYSIGKGKPGYILFDKEPEKIDIMYGFATDIFMNEADLIQALQKKPKQKINDWYDWILEYCGIINAD